MTTIVMCGDQAAPPDVVGDARVVVVHDLCRRLRDLEQWVPDDEQHLVLAVHNSRIDLGSAQAAVRRVGFDPLGVGLLYLETVATDADRAVALAGVIERSKMAEPVDPAKVKLLSPERATRRALLSVGKPRYVGAPGIDADRCSAGDGCHVCVDRCPAEALSSTGGTVSHDIEACVVCGQCVTACPAGAIENPTSTPTAIEAEIRAVVAAAVDPPGIRIRCRGANVPAEAGWYQLEVPCTSMLEPGWVLAPLTLGAGAVDVVPCSAGGCANHFDDRTTAVLEDTATLLGRLGLPIDRPLEHPVALEAPAFAPGATARLADALAAEASEAWQIELGAAGVGVITIDPGACTACERCTAICPSGALALGDDADQVTISFDPNPCTACGSCLEVCPEIEQGAIALRRGVDLAELRLGRRTVREEAFVACEVCGEPVAPQGMLARIEAMLGDEHADALAVIGRRCQRCRGR